MTASELLLLGGIVVNLFAWLIYIYSILKNETKPSQAGMLIYTLSLLSIGIASLKLGASMIAYIPIISGVFSFICFLLSFSRGKEVEQWTIFDKAALLIFAISLIFWFWQNNPWYGLLLNLLIDTIGSLVIAVKIYKNPQTESSFSWFMSFFASFLGLLSIKVYSFENYSFVLFNSFVCFLIMLLSLRKLNTKNVL